MKAQEFCYWLQGHFELMDPDQRVALSARQVDLIRRHLRMVFIHDIDLGYPAEQQQALSDAHAGIAHIVRPDDTPPGVVARC